MARLSRGENANIDRINDLVENVINGVDLDRSTEELLKLFKPLILKLCSKWSKHFNDENHRIKDFDELVCDTEYWFVHYTRYKYTIDGSATFNTFIMNHLDQRIRFMYEQELNYYKKLIFPDPDKRSDDEIDSFDTVIYNYSSNCDCESFDDDIILEEDANNRRMLATEILKIIDCGVFTIREREIFVQIICNGVTHEEMAKRLGVSRTRVTQILVKIKAKLYKLMNNNQKIWDLVDATGVKFDEQ